MTGLNEQQEKIAAATDGVVVVDAGPGTGKTHTIVRRYLNILKKEVSPSDILMLTFTNNAAAETEERVIAEITSSGGGTDVRSSTFDSFCMRVVMESPETVGRFFKTKETLTRNAGLVQNESLNNEYFRNVYTKFIRRYGKMYGNIPAIVGTATEDVHNVIQKLMSVGIVPTHDGEWFGRDTNVLLGNSGELTSLLLTDIDKISKEYGDAENLSPERSAETVTKEMIEEAVEGERGVLLRFINGVYYEFIRSSIADNRLTFGLNAMFAFVILYSNRHIRNMMSFRYVMIDEFQDTNELQFMISLLILKESNLCVVGDWKQGIYGFRYASIENITYFEERLNEMKEFLNKGEKRIVPKISKPRKLCLTENYRSTQHVIDTSFGALFCRANADEEIDDKLSEKVTRLRSVRDHGSTRTEKLHAENYDKEILAILQKINEYVTDPGYKIVEYDRAAGTVSERPPGYGDIAVLCRNGAMCIDVKNKASEYDIPAHLQGDVDIMATREGKLLLAWLRYINNKKDVRGPVAILADMGYTLAEMRIMFPKKFGTDDVPDGIREQRSALMGKKRRITDLLTSIFLFHGLNNDITQSIISTVAGAHGNGMLTISDIIGLMESDIRRGSKYNVDALLDGRSVMIQTMHKSKGLEYPIVIAGGLNTRKMPSTNNKHPLITFDPLYGARIKKEYGIINGHHELFDSWEWKIVKHATGPDRDGERRLFFVALSRAKQYLTLTSSGDGPSYFFKDIPGTVTETDPDPEKMPSGTPEAAGERPSVPEYARRRKRVSLHDLMGDYEESGGGKGEEFGIRIHKEAQRIMNGMDASEDNDETRYIRKIFDHLKDGKIMTEIDCSLPIKDITIAGRIDMMAVSDDHVEVHDFKTDMNRSNEPRYKIQMSVYAHAASSLGRPVRCYIDYVSQGMSIEVPILGIEEIYGLVERL
ncbi:MAG: ATP-dependent helicase [Methanomassiliicoccaceae archaeon]|nr:ATP-dependent helicase [Methanomassiliicoccaceae archaeon]